MEPSLQITGQLARRLPGLQWRGDGLACRMESLILRALSPPGWRESLCRLTEVRGWHSSSPDWGPTSEPELGGCLCVAWNPCSGIRPFALLGNNSRERHMRIRNILVGLMTAAWLIATYVCGAAPVPVKGNAPFKI